MKRIAGLIVCLMILVQTSASACWMFLSIEEIEQQAEVIVIGRLNGDIREVRRSDGSGVTYWSLDVLHLFRGEVGDRMEVATGGLVTAPIGKQAVMLSTDYRLDSHGELMLLYLSDDFDDGSYWPITPRAIVTLEPEEGGEVLGMYSIASTQHAEDLEDILASLERVAGNELSTLGFSAPSKPPRESLPLFAAVTGTFSLALIALKDRRSRS